MPCKGLEKESRPANSLLVRKNYLRRDWFQHFFANTQAKQATKTTTMNETTHFVDSPVEVASCPTEPEQQVPDNKVTVDCDPAVPSNTPSEEQGT